MASDLLRRYSNWRRPSAQAASQSLSILRSRQARPAPAVSPDGPSCLPIREPSKIDAVVNKWNEKNRLTPHPVPAERMGRDPYKQDSFRSEYGAGRGRFVQRGAFVAD
jgi:hypothetical protein